MINMWYVIKSASSFCFGSSSLQLLTYLSKASLKYATLNYTWSFDNWEWEYVYVYIIVYMYLYLYLYIYIWYRNIWYDEGHSEPTTSSQGCIVHYLHDQGNLLWAECKERMWRPVVHKVGSWRSLCFWARCCVCGCRFSDSVDTGDTLASSLYIFCLHFGKSVLEWPCWQKGYL